MKFWTFVYQPHFKLYLLFANGFCLMNLEISRKNSKKFKKHRKNCQKNEDFPTQFCPEQFLEYESIQLSGFAGGNWTFDGAKMSKSFNMACIVFTFNEVNYDQQIHCNFMNIN